MKGKEHPSLGTVPKGKSRNPREGAKCDHPSLGAEVGNHTAPNNPNKTASGQPAFYEGGEPKLQKSVKKTNYHDNPKHLKQ